MDKLTLQRLAAAEVLRSLAAVESHQQMGPEASQGGLMTGLLRG